MEVNATFVVNFVRKISLNDNNNSSLFICFENMVYTCTYILEMSIDGSIHI